MRQTILFTSFLAATLTFSQVPDSVLLGPGYTNESYYSLHNGEVENVINNNWDLAFDLSAYGGAIRLNRKIDILYLYPGAASDWSTLDTSGYQSWATYIDAYNSWSEGALNNCAAAGVDTDMGWGEYNTITHITNGSRIFIIKLSDGSFRKLFIEQLSAGVYTFKYSNIDGSNEVNETITKSDYAGINFIHYSILNEQLVEREPASADWDLLFTNYVLELAPGYFTGVTSVLTNSTFRNLSVAKIDDVTANDAAYQNAIFTDTINTIGYNWKYFDSGTFTYVIEDSLSYFIQDENQITWKIIFTGFGGSSNGKIVFTKQQVTFLELADETKNAVLIYPNPASDYLTIKTAENTSSVSLYSMNGKLVTIHQTNQQDGIITLPVHEIESGTYIAEILNNDGTINISKVIISH